MTQKRLRKARKCEKKFLTLVLENLFSHAYERIAGISAKIFTHMTSYYMHGGIEWEQVRVPKKPVIT